MTNNLPKNEKVKLASFQICENDTNNSVNMMKAIAIILQGTEHSSMLNKTIRQLLYVLGHKFQCCTYFIFAKAQFQLHIGSLISSVNVNFVIL